MSIKSIKPKLITRNLGDLDIFLNFTPEKVDNALEQINKGSITSDWVLYVFPHYAIAENGILKSKEKILSIINFSEAIQYFIDPYLKNRMIKLSYAIYQKVSKDKSFLKKSFSSYLNDLQSSLTLFYFVSLLFEVKMSTVMNISMKSVIDLFYNLLTIINYDLESVDELTLANCIDSINLLYNDIDVSNEAEKLYEQSNKFKKLKQQREEMKINEELKKQEEVKTDEVQTPKSTAPTTQQLIKPMPKPQPQIIKTIPVPNALTITLNTSVPGFQKIIYKPKMTLPDITSSEVCFDPLIKLEQSVINKVPKEYRVKEFFIRGLFDSLINFHGIKPEISLEEATKRGYVNHNIFVTINNILRPGSILYINKEPYVIADMQITHGNWKIDKKPELLPLDIKEVTSPFLYNKMINQELTSVQNELSSIPNNIKYGMNYDRSLDVAVTPKIIAPPELKQGPSQLLPSSINPPPPPLTPLTQEQPVERKTIGLPEKTGSLFSRLPWKKTDETVKDKDGNLLMLERPRAEKIKIGSEFTDLTPSATNKCENIFNKWIQTIDTNNIRKEDVQRLLDSGELNENELNYCFQRYNLLKNKDTPIDLKKLTSAPIPQQQQEKEQEKQISETPSADIQELEEELPSEPPIRKQEVLQRPFIEKIQSSVEPKLKPSPKSNKALRSFFLEPKYYNLLNTLFKNMNDVYKENLQDYLNSIIGNIEIQKGSDNYSRKGYNENVKQIKAIHNDGSGDCFFIALAQALNHNNFYDKIISHDGITGNGNNIYTVTNLRRIISEYYIENVYKKRDEGSTYYLRLQMATEIAEDLNYMFNKKVDDDLMNVGIDIDNNKIDRFNFANQKIQQVNISDLTYETLEPEIEYMSNIDYIYDTSDIEKFLVKKPKNYDEIVDKKKPFIVIPDNETAIVEYLNSRDYWADEETLKIVTEIFGLYILILDYNESNNLLKIANQQYLKMPDDKEDKINWFDYLFMFRRGQHYESVIFEYNVTDYQTKIALLESKKKIKPKKIEKMVFSKTNRFDKEYGLYPPPFYIFYLIYATYYSFMETNSKSKVIKGFKKWMEEMEDGFIHMITRVENRVEDSIGQFTNYVKNFNDVFKIDILQQTILNKLMSTSKQPANNINVNQVINIMQGTTVRQIGGDKEKEDKEKEKRKLEKMKKKERDSNLSYYVTIDVELKRGTTLSKEELSTIKCRSSWNSIRRSYADLTGQKYVIPPVYEESKKEKPIQSQTKKGGKRSMINKKTRKNRN